MGDVVSHLPDLGDQRLDAVQHLIEGHRQLIDLVAPVLHGDPLFEGSPGDALRGSGDRLDARNRTAGHEPADPRRQADEQGHRDEKNPPEGVNDPRVVFHGLADLKDDAGADHGVEDAHLILAGRQDDRFDHPSGAAEQLPDRLFADGDVLPVGHVGRGKGLAGRVEKAEKDLFLPGRLGFEEGEVFDRPDPAFPQNRRKLPRLIQQLLIRFFLDHGGDERVKQEEGDKGGRREDAGVPQGQAEGEAIPEATGFL